MTIRVHNREHTYTFNEVPIPCYFVVIVKTTITITYSYKVPMSCIVYLQLKMITATHFCLALNFDHELWTKLRISFLSSSHF